MEIYNSADKIKKGKEQSECFEEFFQVQRYKNDIFCRRENPIEIQNFINKIVDKYSSKPEVQNFYTSNGNNNAHMNQYDTLDCIERMLLQYASVKGAETHNKQ